MIERILIGLDEGELADGAIEAALRLADVFSAQIEFLHAVPGFWGWTSFSEVYGPRVTAAALEEAQAGRRAFLEHRLAGTSFDLATLDERLIVVLDRAGDAIVERARQPGADLVVLGEHQKHGVLDFGGTGRAVLGSCPCPVWLQRKAVGPIGRILAPISADEDSVHTLTLACTLAKAFGASVEVLHAFAPPVFAYPAAEDLPATGAYVVDDLRRFEREAFERMVAEFDWQGVETRAEFVEGVPAECILAREGVDLICMGTHTRNRLARAVLGSEAYAVLRHAEVPVVACPLPA